MFAKSGCSILSEVGFDGLKELLLNGVGPNKQIQRGKPFAQYHTATQDVKEETPFVILRMEILETEVKDTAPESVPSDSGCFSNFLKQKVMGGAETQERMSSHI